MAEQDPTDGPSDPPAEPGGPPAAPPPHLPASFGGEWQLDADVPELELAPEPEPVPEPVPPPPPPPSPAPKRGRSPSLFPATRAPQGSDEPPPSPEQLVEAMLFVGGNPLTPAVACSAVRGLTPEAFQQAVDSLNRRYRAQRRPYSVQPRDGGFVLAVGVGFRDVREKLFGGPREARLSQPALDVLSVVAYRQPVSKPEVDAVRGTDSGGQLRLLVRLGLVAVRHRGEAGGRDVRYGTTPRFLEVFGLSGLDELPRLGETQPVP